ncbi:hypothetical protein JVT61DRAFT_8937 [Boletus reticuloceps]|uniref:Uncharacterized protein n=1 Tax=Boletus reticuloceps TaxID=495285 RepID=A0A8I3A6F5_9AGAM|nr:hypothetical protein JVT61DRAFT_8937 [Boletus reticuloceps]
MNNIKVLTIGGSRNIGYFSSIRLLGGTPHFELTKGFVVLPPNLVTQSLLNCLKTLPTLPQDHRDFLEWTYSQ